MICKCGHESDIHMALSGMCTNIAYPFSEKLRYRCPCNYFDRITNLDLLLKKYEEKTNK